MSHGAASDLLDCWLRPLYTPLAHRMLEDMRSDLAVGDDTDELERKASGATAMLNQHCITHEGGIPTYQYSTVADQAGMWGCTCVATRKDGSQL